MTESTKNADFRRKLQIFADSPLLLEIPAFGGRRKAQKTADFRRKPQIFAENRRKPQIGFRHLRCVTFSSALKEERLGVTLQTNRFETTRLQMSFQQALGHIRAFGTENESALFHQFLLMSGALRLSG